MPDIWTKHPDVVKRLLEAGDFECGKEPRIFKDRDPESTCIVDGETIYGDLYVHHISELPEKPPASVAEFLPFLVVGLVLGFILTKLFSQTALLRK